MSYLSNDAILSDNPSEDETSTIATELYEGAAPFSLIWEAIHRTKEEFKLCPNRVWAVAKSLPEREHILPSLIPPAGDITVKGHKGHQECTFDFCEYSRRDFTAVEQRHESSPCGCRPLYDMFHEYSLNEAIRNGQLTAWTLDGRSMIKPPQPFMAISHVWSDGTGAGQGQVNTCLYDLFKDIAEQFQCEGVWWDTICIPRDKVARSQAISRMQNNYEEARITLVHDCYLREWKWDKAETACFAIIMSPWFSRGWTSLELAKSRKVKVLFKGAHGPIVKDLDEDILAQVDQSRHRAAQLILNLRNTRITKINDLLMVLGSRYTSWPRDTAIISGLLVGTGVPSEWQKDIYQAVLKKISKVCQSQLFHNSATMSGGFSWCPTSLLDMQPSPQTSLTLDVGENGNLTGWWEVIDDFHTVSKDRYNWKGTHPLVEARLRSALHSAWEKPGKHLLLAELAASPDPDAYPPVRRKSGSITRAILVEITTQRGAMTKTHFIGPVYFSPPLDVGDINGQIERVIVGGAEGTEIREANPDCSTGETIRTQSVQPNQSDDSKLRSAFVHGDEEEILRLLGNQPKLDFVDQERSWTGLHYATWKCYVEVVKMLIDPNRSTYRESINHEDTLGQRVIHLAAERGNKEIIDLLLEAGANPSDRCKDKQTALHRAVWGCSKAVVQKLLEMVDPDISDSVGQTALHIATRKGYSSIISLLLGKATPSIPDLKGQTAMHLAAQHGQMEAVGLLLANKVDINARDKHGHMPLHLAAAEGNEGVVQLLLDNGADEKAQGWDQRTPLQLASEKGKEMVVQLLLGKGVDVETQDWHRQTPLHLASKEGRQEVVQLLLKKGADTNTLDSNKQTPLHLAVAEGHEEIVRQLLDSGADFTTGDKNGQTPLHLASKKGEAVVQLLRNKGADITIPDSNGQTPLHLAVAEGKGEIVLLLLAMGGDFTAQDRNGQTPLHLACQKRDETVVQLLLNKGADVKTEDGKKQTSLHVAAEWGNEKVAQLLLGKGADVKTQDSNGETPLHLAAGGYIGEVTLHKAVRDATTQLLLDNGADIKAQDEDGQTPLHLAAESARERVVQVLLAKGADATAQDKNGRTPLHLAATSYGNIEVARLLLAKGADVKAQDVNGVTPAGYGEYNSQAMRQLLENGADRQVEKVVLGSGENINVPMRVEEQALSGQEA